MLWESKVDEIVSDSIFKFVRDERKREIEEIGVRWDFYNGNQERYIRKFHDEEKDEYDEKLKITFNYTQLIVDEYVNYVFGMPFSLIFENPQINEIWESIYQSMVFNKIPTFMMTTQRIAEISDTCGIIVRWDDKNKKTKFEHVRGEYLFPLPDVDNPHEIGEIAIFYTYYTGDPKDPYYNYLEIWNKETYTVLKWSEKTKKFVGTSVEKEPNPYGFIPIVLFQPKQDDNSFYGVTNVGDVVNINKIYNDLWTDLGLMVDYQSFSMMVVRSSKTLDFTVAPRRLIKLDEVDVDEKAGEEVKYITPDAKINDVKNVLQIIKGELQNISLVPSSVIQTGSVNQAQSGYSLRIKRMPFEGLTDNKKTSYGPSMLDLAKMGVKIDLYHRTGDIPSDDKLAATMDFSEMPNTYSPQEQMATDEFNMRYNVLTPIELIIRDNPDLTVEQAEKLYYKNKDFNESEIKIEADTDTEDMI